MIYSFLALVLILVFVDLLSTRKREIDFKTSLVVSVIWIALALLFGIFVWFYKGSNGCVEYYTAYLAEKSLSIDNLFVFYLIFSDFKLSPKQQHKLLFMGILGAVVMRGLFIYFGIELIHSFEWMIYVFGAILIWAAIRIVLKKDDEIGGLQKIILTRAKNSEWGIFLPVLIVVELSDLMFAVDSIPAVLAISDDLFIAYTSNVWAILGLRALYFLLANIISKISYLKHGLCIILAFVGLKMMFSKLYDMPEAISLLFIVSVLVGCSFLSLRSKNVLKND